jgi:WD40 repeat protein
MTSVAPAIVRDGLAGARDEVRGVSSSRCHFGRAFDVAFAPWEGDDGTSDEMVVTCGEDGTARAHVVRTSVEGGGAIERDVFVCRGHEAEVVRVGFARGVSSERRRFATGSADGSCKIWNADDGSEARSLSGHPGEVYGCCFLGDGGASTIATCSETAVWAWDIETGARLAKSAPRVATGGDETPERWSPGYLFSMARGLNGVLACGCSDGVVRIYGDGSGGKFGETVAEVRDAHQHTIVGSTCFIDEGRVLCSVGLDGTIALTDTRTWEMFRRISAGTPLMSACGIGSGSWLAMVGKSGFVRAIDAMEQTVASQCIFRPEIDEPVPLFCVASNLKGTMLACAGAGVASSGATTPAFGSTKKADPSRLDVWITA